MKSGADAVIDGEMVTGNFTIQAQLPMGKSITVSGYVYSNNNLDDINKQVDMFHDLIDRQRTRAEIPELEAKLEQRRVALGQMKDALESLSKKQHAGKLSSAERKMVDDMNTSIGRINEDIEKGIEAIAKAKLEVGAD